MRTSLVFLLAFAAVAQTPRPAPAFSILRPGATPIEVSQYRGKVVALAFIDTHCPHCQALTGYLNGIAPKYAARGVQFLECAFNDDAQFSAAQFQQQFHPAFPMGYASRAAVLGFLQISIMDPHPLYVPHMVFIDRRGIIRGDVAGESDFMKQPETNIPAELEKLLKTGAAAKTSAVRK